MVSRRNFIVGGLAAAGTIPFASAAFADDASGGKTNLAEEMVRHADWFIHGNDFTAADLQVDITLDSWSAEEFAGALAMSWDHLEEHGNEAIAQVIDDYRNNDGRRFYDALIKPNGRISQSIPRFIDNIVADAEKVVNAIAGGGRLGRDYDRIFDKKLQAVILNVRDGDLTAEEAKNYLVRAKDELKEGFELFKQQKLLPELRGEEPQVVPGTSLPQTQDI